MIMDLQNKAFNKKYLFIGVTAMAGIMILSVILLIVIPSASTPSAVKLTKTFLVNKIDPNFFKIFNKKPPLPKPKIVAIPKPKPKIVAIPKPAPKPKTEFKDIFNTYKITTKKRNAIEQFLSAANQSTQIRTYQKFGKNKYAATPKPAKIKLGYKELGIGNTNASFPIDFRRVLTADRRIDAILIEDIDSTLGGKVTAQIENNIYAAQGRNILIPIGSKIIGNYQPLSKIGENRLKIIWHRIITPKGVNIVTTSEMADSMGRSGIAGKVDTKFFDKYGLAILISTISALAQSSVSVGSKDKAVFINTYGKELSTLSAKILEEQINIKPTIKIPAGARILISLQQDIWFRDNEGLVKMRPVKQFITAEKTL